MVKSLKVSSISYYSFGAIKMSYGTQLLVSDQYTSIAAPSPCQ